MKNVTKIALLLTVVFALGACCASSETKASKYEDRFPAAGGSYSKADYAKSDKACSVDADCVKVAKGCCQCDGYDAVNKDAAKEINAVISEKCAKAVCTMQMCWNDITPVCENKVCTAKAAENQFRLK
ncbi:hypothetical protein Dip518_000892 [Parelusimicrobium proximum]|uniref:hypothetical protein n=1 Tax=Parelusimicrobium proximum TaxID=3228953 RepID=UPI003D180F51